MRDKEGVRGRGTRKGGQILTGVIAVKAGNSSNKYLQIMGSSFLLAEKKGIGTNTGKHLKDPRRIRLKLKHQCELWVLITQSDRCRNEHMGECVCVHVCAHFLALSTARAREKWQPNRREPIQ